VTTPEVRFAKASDGVSIAYQVFGRGRLDLAYVPGQVSHLDVNWELPSYAEFLRTLGGLARVIMLDRRGMGLSDRLSPGDAPPAEVLADDLGVVLEAALSSKNTVLFGADEGGQICSLYAAAHPERVRGLILYGMTPNGATTDGATPEELANWEEWLASVPPRWGSREAGLFDVRDMIPTAADDDDVVAWAAKLQRSAQSPGAIEPLVRIVMALDVRDVLPSIAVPTLVLHRTDDTAVPIEAARAVGAAIPGARLEELPGEDHLPFAGPWEAVTDAIAGFLGALRGGPSTPTRRLATVVFTDIVGSTERAAELGDGPWRELLARHDALARAQIEDGGGTYVKSTGDGLMATFDGPARAIRCVQALAEMLRPLSLTIRAGIHTGEVEVAGGDITGVGVHIAARVAALAAGDEVLVSSTVKDLTAGSGLSFEDAGEHELKGVPDRWRLYRVVG
jgi:class 3 adenylate cyclase/pimeloyl-ACP methyl ester carboxylesterase